MNLTINGHHLEVTPALREYVLTKLEPITRHFDQVVTVTVLLTGCKKNGRGTRGKCVQKAKTTVHVKGQDIVVVQTDENMYAAVDKMMDALDRQVCRYKDKVQDHYHRPPGKYIGLGVPAMA